MHVCVLLYKGRSRFGRRTDDNSVQLPFAWFTRMAGMETAGSSCCSPLSCLPLPTPLTSGSFFLLKALIPSPKAFSIKLYCGLLPHLPPQLAFLQRPFLPGVDALAHHLPPSHPFPSLPCLSGRLGLPSSHGYSALPHGLQVP